MRSIRGQTRALLPIQSGSTLLELLVSCALLALIVPPLVDHAVRAEHFAKHEASSAQQQMQELRIELLLNSAVIESQGQRLTAGIITHPAGVIRTVSGSVLPLTGLATPHPDGRAVTFLKFKSIEQISVHSVTALATNQYQIIGCAAFLADSIAPTLKGTKALAGITLENSIELKLISSSRIEGGRCYRLDVSPVHSIALGLPENIELLRALYPIHELATYYLSSQFTLRYLSHLGEELSANQPVIDGVEQFSCEIGTVSAFKLARLGCTYQVMGGAKQSLFKLQQLSPTAGLNLMLNQKLLAQSHNVAFYQAQGYAQ